MKRVHLLINDGQDDTPISCSEPALADIHDA